MKKVCDKFLCIRTMVEYGYASCQNVLRARTIALQGLLFGLLPLNPFRGKNASFSVGIILYLLYYQIAVYLLSILSHLIFYLVVSL